MNRSDWHDEISAPGMTGRRLGVSLAVIVLADGRAGTIVVPWRIAVCGQPKASTSDPIDCPDLAEGER